MRCFIEIKGRWYALMNWQARAGRTDNVVLRPMTTRDVERYRSMKADGFIEAAIFAQLYPPQFNATPVKDVVLPVTLLNKSQLIYLIENKLRVCLPSLKKMDREDLVTLLGRL